MRRLPVFNQRQCSLKSMVDRLLRRRRRRRSSPDALRKDLTYLTKWTNLTLKDFAPDSSLLVYGAGFRAIENT
ncbi:MAG TPA: hypothetical protein PLQ56_14215 [Aggregatilineales bacterium]|nr:hypothetical protein [Aggregatilineales bacterium]